MTAFPRMIASGSLVGSTGRQGLPGVNGVENDAAVAGYLANDTSATYAASDDAAAAQVADPASAHATALNAMIAGVAAKAFNLPASNGTDDTAAVQAILDIAGPKWVLGLKGQTYITSGWVIPSETTLDMTGCVVERKAAGGSLLRNSAYRGVGARDNDIYVTGGTWNHRSDLAGVGGGDAGLFNTMNMHRVDGVRVTEATFSDNGGLSKFSLLFSDVTNYSAENIHFVDRPSDGLHVQGPATNGRFKGISGKTGDDFIGITPCDYTANQLTQYGGHIVGLVIDKLYLDDAESGVLLCCGTGGVGGTETLQVRGVTLSNMYGTVLTGNPIRILDDIGSPGTTGGSGVNQDDITIENIYCKNAGAGYGTPYIRMTSTSRANGAKMGTIKCRNIGLIDAGQQVIVDGAVIDTLEIDGLVTHQAVAHTQRPVDIYANSNIGTLKIKGYKGALAAGMNVLQQQGTIARLVLHDIESTGGTSMARLNGATTRVDASDITGTAGIQVLGTENPVVNARNINPTAGTFVSVEGASAGATLFGQNITGNNSISRTASQVCRASGTNMKTDVGRLTPTAGDAIHNTAAANGPATLVVYDGAAWRSVQGYVASGGATLVAGTVTIAHTATTATTKIRVFVQTPAGTTGALYVSAKAIGTSFTITSTSATETSTVRWEVVSYV